MHRRIFIKLFEQVLGITNTAIVSHLLEPKVMVCISECRIYLSIQQNLMGMAATGFGVLLQPFLTFFFVKGIGL